VICIALLDVKHRDLLEVIQLDISKKEYDDIENVCLTISSEIYLDQIDFDFNKSDAV